MHKKLNSMKLINALSLLLLLCCWALSVGSRQAPREKQQLFYLFICFPPHVGVISLRGALYDLRLADFREELFNSMKGY